MDQQAATNPVKSSSGNSGFNWPAHGLRGLAATGVLVGHIAGGLGLHIYKEDASFQIISEYVLNLGTYGVELFFVISGYVIASSALRYGTFDFFFRRFVRIYPVFFFFNLVFVLGNVFLNIEPEKNSLYYSIMSMTFVDIFISSQPNMGGLSPNSWSISFEAWYYLFSGFLVLSMRRAYSLLVFVALASAVFVYYFPISLYFVGGVICYGLRHKYGLRCGKFLWPIEIFSLLIVLGVASRNHFVYVDGDFKRLEVILLLVSTSVFFFAVTENGSLIGKILSASPLRFLGTISYSLYLSHPYVYFVWRIIFIKAGIFALPMLVAIPLFFFATIAGSLIVAYFVNITLERKPYEMIFHSKVYHGK